ncbi:hypothetical protein [Cellulomonas endophytica]|uniref:hypothetical protein n=1 Tax=Cellulomonas endophytica TaxID=2494735 RepID=UPI0010129BC7|nr:hypothetical protein [Cellulomonas endophytica]
MRQELVRGLRGRRAAAGVRARARAAGAGLGVAAVLALGACAGQPGAAAVVDGREITSADVAEVRDQLGGVLQGVTSTNVLAVLVQEPVVTELAADRGVAVSDDEARAALTQAVTAAGGEVPELGPASLAVGRYLVATNNLQGLEDAEGVSAELLERVAEQDVEVNPRYGSLDERNTVVAPTPVPWLVAPSADPAAVPTPTPAP